MPLKLNFYNNNWYNKIKNFNVYGKAFHRIMPLF